MTQIEAKEEIEKYIEFAKKDNSVTLDIINYRMQDILKSVFYEFTTNYIRNEK